MRFTDPDSFLKDERITGSKMRLSGAARRAAMPLLLLIVCIGFFWKLVLTTQYTWLDQPDNVYQVMPWLQEQMVQWKAGHFPLWSPHLWGGQPWIGQVQPATLNPLNWILFSLPTRAGFLRIPYLHWYFVIIHYLGALAFYALLRGLPLPRRSAVFGACAFALGGYMGTTGWSQLLMSAVLLPLVLLFLMKAWDDGHDIFHAATAGLLLGASFLTGHHNLPFFALAGVLVVYAVALLNASPVRRLPLLTSAAACFTCFGLVAAVQILPSLELGNLSVRWVGAQDALGFKTQVPYYVHDSLSIGSESLFGLILPQFARGWDPYIGVIVVTFAAIGVIACWESRHVRVLLGVAIGGLVFALAGSLYHGLLYALVPGLDKARSPGMATAFLHIGLAGLAAHGLEACCAPVRLTAQSHRILLRALVILAVTLTGFTAALTQLNPDKAYTMRAVQFTALVAAGLCLLLYAWFRNALSDRTAVVLALLLLLFELHPATTYNYRSMQRDRFALQTLEEHNDLANFLKTRPQLVRVDVDHGAIRYNFGDWFSIDEMMGYQPGVIRYVHRVLSSGRPHVRDLMAVSHYLSRAPARDNQKQVFEGKSGIKVYENPAAFPRIWAAHQFRSMANEEEAAAVVIDNKYDFRRTVILETVAPDVKDCAAPDHLHLASYQPARVVIATDLGCNALVVLADTWFPGWKARVDGREAPIYRAYSFLRSVPVPAGKHQLIFEYSPGNFWLSLLLLPLAILVWGCCFKLRTAESARS